MSIRVDRMLRRGWRARPWHGCTMAAVHLDSCTPLETPPPVRLRERVCAAGGSGAAGVLWITAGSLSVAMLVVEDEEGVVED